MADGGNSNQRILLDMEKRLRMAQGSLTLDKLEAPQPVMVLAMAIRGLLSISKMSESGQAAKNGCDWAGPKSRCRTLWRRWSKRN